LENLGNFFILCRIKNIKLIGVFDMLNFVLCDDNELILTKLCQMLEAIFIKNNLSAQIVFSSTNYEEILKYVKNNEVNVLLLDIELKAKLTGIEIANIIRKDNKNLYLIFTTGHLEYGLVAYQCKTFDYLSKPITLERLESTILRLFEDISYSPNKFLKIKNCNTVINLDSIHFIRKDGMKLIFYTDTREYQIYSSFSKISESLPSNFVRCHKSYIININKITNIQASLNTVLFEHDKCYIGPKYKNNLMEVLEKC
jgi:two-component system response regulator AgrA